MGLDKSRVTLLELYRYCDGLADFVLAANKHGYKDKEIVAFIVRYNAKQDASDHFGDFRPGDMKG